MCIYTGTYTAIAFQITVLISSCFTGRAVDPSLVGKKSQELSRIMLGSHLSSAPAENDHETKHPLQKSLTIFFSAIPFLK